MYFESPSCVTPDVECTEAMYTTGDNEFSSA